MHSVEIPLLSPVRGYIRSFLSFWFTVEIRGLGSLEVDRPASLCWNRTSRINQFLLPPIHFTSLLVAWELGMGTAYRESNLIFSLLPFRFISS
jgi:hypothetical protein